MSALAPLSVPNPPPPAATSDALVVEHLEVSYRVAGEQRVALRDVSFRVGRRESYGIVGESGSGKSTIALALMRYLPGNGRISKGRVTVGGTDLLALDRARLRALRAGPLSMVYQEPGRALNPSIRVGRQVAEVFELAGTSKGEALERAEAALRQVRISDPGRVLRRYPHQLSGGMLQRVVIAMALASRPSLLILDEPTTALDATVEAEVLELITALRSELDTSLVFISHNLAVIAEMCDRVGVLYAGELVEEGSAEQVFESPRHPYTVGLLRCIPRRGQRKDAGRLETIPGFLPTPGAALAGCIFAPRCALATQRCESEHPPLYEAGPGRISRCHYHEQAGELPPAGGAAGGGAATGGAGAGGAGAGGAGAGGAGAGGAGAGGAGAGGAATGGAAAGGTTAADAPLVAMRGVSKTFNGRSDQVRALVGIDLDVPSGQTLGLVGESGSGKTTLARALLGLGPADAGSVIDLAGRPLPLAVEHRRPQELRAVQIVFQNPDSALNRRHSVRRILSRVIRRFGGLGRAEAHQRLGELIASVRMEPRHLDLRPAQLSGGLKQRVAIARAFAGKPALVVCDEPTSALDVSVQAAILNLLADLQAREGVSYVFISHDLGVVRYLSDRIAVLYLGRLMEVGPAEQVFSAPHHPYTEALLSAVPSLDGRRRERIRLEGEIPSAADPPSGCVFHTRCPRRLADGSCETLEPPLAEVAPGRLMRCHIPLAELARLQRSAALGDPAATGTAQAQAAQAQAQAQAQATGVCTDRRSGQ